MYVYNGLGVSAVGRTHVANEKDTRIKEKGLNNRELQPGSPQPHAGSAHSIQHTTDVASYQWVSQQKVTSVQE